MRISPLRSCFVALPLCAGFGVAAGQPTTQGAASVLDDPVNLAALIEQDVAARPTYVAPVAPNFGVPGGAGDSSLRIGGYVQTRYTANRRDTDVEDNDLTHGFGFREIRLNFSGTLVTKSLSYYIQAAFDSGDARFSDLWLRYRFDDHWAVKFGAFKPMFLWEQNSASRNQLMAERSIVDNYFQGGRAQQVELSYGDDRFQASVALDDGWRNHTDSRVGDAWGLTARGQWLAFGTWAQHEDMQAWRGQEPMLVLGMAGHMQDGSPWPLTTSETRNRFLNGSEIVSWTGDAHFEARGLVVYGAVMGEHIRPSGDDGGDGTARDAIGVMVQAGYFVTDNVQLIGRVEWATTDGDVGRPTSIESREDEFAAVTLGAAYYFWGNHAKLVADVVIPLDEVGDVWGFASRGVLTDDAGADGQVAFRVLFQWVF